MSTWSNTLFYIVFLGQIFLTSFVIPRKVQGRMRQVVESYPPSNYPKLYPQPTGRYMTAQWIYKKGCQFTFVLGLVVLFAMMFCVEHSTITDDGFISEAWPAAYGIIQFLPLIALEFSAFGHLKLMRRSNSATTRKAELRRRRLSDVVSPRMQAITVALVAGSIFFDFYVHDFDVAWGDDTIRRTITLILTNLFLIGIGVWLFYGRKLDPYQSYDDWARRMGTNITSNLLVSIVLSVYFMVRAASDVYNLDAIDAVLMSAYFQLIVLLSTGHMLRNTKLEDIDFGVYKDDDASVREHSAT